MADDQWSDSGNHALLTGEILGALIKCGLKARVQIDDDGDYTNEIIVERPSGEWIVRVEPHYG